VKAIRVYEAGGPEVMRYEDVPDPVPGVGQVLIQVLAAGINFSDTGARRHAEGALPYTPGTEAAGRVVGLGPGVTQFQIGDLVACQYQPPAGCYAEKAAINVSGTVKIPEGIAPEDAAAAMLQGRTAYAMAFQAYQTKPGDRVLIHAAAGGVGLLMTQMTKHAGARVFATVGSDAKAEAAWQAGADIVINYSVDDFSEAVNRETGGVGVNAIFDSVGRQTFLKDFDCLASRGYVVSYGQASGTIPLLDTSLLARSGGYVTRTNARRYAEGEHGWRSQVEQVFAMLTDGWLKLRITRYPLAEAAVAHRDLEERRSIGKLLLIP
jgi:NADPH2:quinone reductase